MADLLTSVIADLRKQAGNSLADELAGMVERGLLEPVEIAPGEYGLRSTELGIAMAESRRAGRKH